MVESVGLSGVVVLGMDRSGTSATTRMFQRSGFFVGAEMDLMDADDANPTGYYENLTVWRANEEALRDLGYSLNAPHGLERLTPDDHRLAPLRQVLDDLLIEAGPAPIALKDPRISMLIRLWQPVFEGVLHPVLAVRHPVEVALSLERRDGTPIPLGLALWEHRIGMLIDALDGAEVSVAPYSRLLTESSIASEMVVEAAALLQPSLQVEVDCRKASGAFDPGVRRIRAAGAEGVPELNRRQRRLWEFVDSLDAGLMKLEAHPGWSG